MIIFIFCERTKYFNILKNKSLKRLNLKYNYIIFLKNRLNQIEIFFVKKLFPLKKYKPHFKNFKDEILG